MMFLLHYYKPKRLFHTDNVLIEELKKTPAWCNYSEGIWLLGTAETLAQLSTRLESCFDRSTDSWLLTRFSYEHIGWLPSDAVNWIVETEANIGI